MFEMLESKSLYQIQVYVEKLEVEIERQRALVERIKIPVRDYTNARHFTGCRCDMCEWLKDASGEVKDASKCLDKLK